MTGTEMIDQPAERARDSRGRTWLWFWVSVALFGVALIVIAYFQQSDRTDALEGDVRALYDQVEDMGGTPVVQPPAVDDPDPDDADPDDPERQDAETQDPEQQDPEVQDPEVQDPELADVEVDDPDPDDPEIQDPEIDDPSIPGPQGEQGPPGPTCPPGYVAQDRVYDPSPVPGDEETWWVCVAEGGAG
jgi:hypothetical protein